MITIDLIGRLGNQMFQYAICRTIAEKNNYKFYVKKDKNLHNQNISDYFDLDMGIDDGSQIIHRFCEDSLKQTFNPSIFQIPDNTHIWGFYQSEKYFQYNESDVKSWFNINCDDKTKDLLNKYPIDKYCYIHFRGTDYKEWDSGTRFLPFKYFNDAINDIKSKNQSIKFLVITDDIECAKEYFNDFPIVSNDMMVDFKLLYYSLYCIIPNSSFSWWAAWLSNNKKVTIAPNNWLNYNMPEKGFYPNDIQTNKFYYL